jgi:polar amino acid transport system substrate-binding protein
LKRTRRGIVIAGLLGAVAPWRANLSVAQSASAETRSSLAPTGRLRIAINYSNAALAHRDAETGKLTGVSVDIADELGRRIDLPVVLVPFDGAGKVSAAATSDVWDVAFMGRDPERARDISFTAPYVVIDGSYVVRNDSPLTTILQVDQEGVRIAVSKQSAYDLFLSRALKKATILRADGTAGAVALFRSERLDVVAGVKQALQKAIADDPGLRMIPEPFMEINQAMGVPAGRSAGASYLKAFVEDIKSRGFVKQVLERNGQAEATVAPPG